MSLRWVDINEIKDAIADVRSDKTPTNWVLLSYQGENSNDVGLVGKGDGGVNDFISHLKDGILVCICVIVAFLFAFILFFFIVT